MTLEPSRIILARQRAGLPKTALARAAGVAPRTVTTWESRGAPSSRLSDIAGATGMPAEFFSGGAIDLLEEDRIFFRARRRSPSALLHRSAAFGSLGIGFYDSIRRRFRTPAPSVPEAEPGDSPRQAARALRLAWRMGMGPAPNLVQLAEAHGIRVLGIPLADAAVDAFSFWAPDGRPFVFLSRIKTAERSRFDLAHEIGHLVLHCDVTGTGETTDREIEREADVFAAELLLPTEALRARVRGAPSIEDLMRIKSAYGASAMAAARSIRDAGLLSKWGHRQLVATLTSRGFHTGEPGSTLPYEKSRVFSTVLERLRAEGVAVADWAKGIGLRPDDVADFMFGQALRAAPDADTASPQDVSGGGAPPAARPSLRVVT